MSKHSNFETLSNDSGGARCVACLGHPVIDEYTLVEVQTVTISLSRGGIAIGDDLRFQGNGVPFFV